MPSVGREDTVAFHVCSVSRKVEMLLADAPLPYDGIVTITTAEQLAGFAKAVNEARLKKEQADREIEQEKARAQKEMREEIIEVALAAAQKIVERELNEQDEREFVEKFVEEGECGSLAVNFILIVIFAFIQLAKHTAHLIRQHIQIIL